MTDDRVLDNGEDLPLFRVAVVVFTNVRGVDYSDAGHIAEHAVSRACRSEDGGLRWVRESPTHLRERQVDVVDTMELSIAMGNGYVGALPLNKAYRYRGTPAGELPESVVRGWSPEDDDD